MSGQDSGDDGVVTGINVTPLVDVVLVLLIIFMITAHLTSHGELKINLPRTAGAELSPTSTGLTVSLDGEGRLFLMEEAVDLNGLKANLAREAELNPGVRVTLAAEGRIPYQQVVKVLDTIKQSGVTRVALASEQSGSEP
ncbi:MAG: biopolymer transporter ExbD [Candidatus Manganitrophaceae bacterium]|nr:MAG: biopolymer transporter ExbD [Candidatus Manganitrophaceae bacterium]